MLSPLSPLSLTHTAEYYFVLFCFFCYILHLFLFSARFAVLLQLICCCCLYALQLHMCVVYMYVYTNIYTIYMCILSCQVFSTKIKLLLIPTYDRMFTLRMSLANWIVVATLGGHNVTRRRVCQKYQKRVTMHLMSFYGSPGRNFKYHYCSVLFTSEQRCYYFLFENKLLFSDNIMYMFNNAINRYLQNKDIWQRCCYLFIWRAF